MAYPIMYVLLFGTVIALLTLLIYKIRKQDRQLLLLQTDLQNIVRAIPDTLLELGQDGRILRVWSLGLDLVAAPQHLLMGKRLSDLFPAKAVSTLTEALQDAHENGYTTGWQIELLLEEESQWFEVSISRKQTSQASEAGFILISRNITKRKNFESKLQQSEEHFRFVTESAQAMIWMCDKDKLCIWFNKVWLDFRGRPLEEELGNGWTEGVHPDDLAYCWETFATNFEHLQPFSMEYRLMSGDGEYRWILDIGRAYFDNRGNFKGYIGSCFDVTERRRFQEKLELLATSDELTGAINRRHFVEQANKETKRAQRYNLPLTFSLIDIDHFKHVNDTYGHQGGDQVLKELAQVFKANLRETDIFARLGGDEFVVLLPQTNHQEARELIERIREIFDTSPLELAGQRFCITISCGIASLTGSNDCAEAVLGRADQALYASKHAGRNKVTVHETH